jgi:hypothetical protein
MRHGGANHPTNDWLERPAEYHIGRSIEHLRLWQDGDQPQDHISPAATRLLMALTLRGDPMSERENFVEQLRRLGPSH